MEAIFLEFRNGLAIELERLDLPPHVTTWRKAIRPELSAVVFNQGEDVPPVTITSREETWEMIAAPHGRNGLAFFAKVK